MKEMWILLSVLWVLAHECDSQLESHGSEGRPWPMPQSWQLSPVRYTVDVNQFSFTTKGQSCDTLLNAFPRYYERAFYMKSSQFNTRSRADISSSTSLTELSVELTSACEKYPVLNSDESYSLDINGGTDEVQASLKSNSVWGILRGLETFTHLIYQNEVGTFYVNQTSIMDFPRFRHRGALLDTSRHFLSKARILEFLDVMEMNKFNVFHWHIVDDQSFPYESEIYPNLSIKGSYNRNSHVYSRNTITEIIEYARLRGIRVIPEFDTPGHTQSWGKGLPDLLTACYDSHGSQNGNFGPVDPSRNTTYTFLQAFLKEVADLFPDMYIHLGGDEVNFSCWKSSPTISSFMKLMGFGTDYSKLEQYYIQRVLDIVKELGSRYIIWQEPIDNGVKVAEDTVVEVWKTGWEKEMSRVTDLGLKAILSTPWYLNRISYGADWENHYQVEPLSFNGTATQNGLVVGGEACMWGEWVDATNLMSRFWPRGSAVAERLWSDKSVNDVNKARPRLQEHRCRMIRRGVGVEPVTGPGYCLYEF